MSRTTSLTKDPPHDGGRYAFVLPGWDGKLPMDVKRVEVPYPSTQVAIRIDKYASDGEDQISAANQFRADLCMQTLAEYDPEHTNPLSKTLVTPLFLYAPSVKLMADETLATAPQAFLTTLQQAMASPTTEPLTDDDRALIQRFDDVFAAAQAGVQRDSRPLTDIIRGAQAAHAAIIDRWQSNRGSTNWIHFDNIGDWGTAYLDRAALTEYIQCGNDRKSALRRRIRPDGAGRSGAVDRGVLVLDRRVGGPLRGRRVHAGPLLAQRLGRHGDDLRRCHPRGGDGIRP